MAESAAETDSSRNQAESQESKEKDATPEDRKENRVEGKGKDSGGDAAKQAEYVDKVTALLSGLKVPEAEVALRRAPSLRWDSERAPTILKFLGMLQQSTNDEQVVRALRRLDLVTDSVKDLAAVRAIVRSRRIRDRAHLPPRDPFYVRTNLYAETERAFASPKPATVALVGSQGIGKSAAAREYVHRHYHKYQKVFWISGDRWCEDLKVVMAQCSVEDHDALKQYLSKLDSYLIVCDNVSPSFELDLPTEPGNHRLLTAREVAKTWAGRLIESPRPSHDQCLSMLAVAAGVPLTLDMKPEDAVDARDLGILTDVCSNHPLEIRRLGRAIRRGKVDAFTVRRHVASFAPAYSAIVGPPRPRDRINLVMTSSLAWKAISRNADPSVKRLLHIISFWGSRRIPLRLLQERVRYPNTARGLELIDRHDAALAWLRRSLILVPEEDDSMMFRSRAPLMAMVRAEQTDAEVKSSLCHALTLLWQILCEEQLELSGSAGYAPFIEHVCESLAFANSYSHAGEIEAIRCNLHLAYFVYEQLDDPYSALILALYAHGLLHGNTSDSVARGAERHAILAFTLRMHAEVGGPDRIAMALQASEAYLIQAGRAASSRSEVLAEACDASGCVLYRAGMYSRSFEAMREAVNQVKRVAEQNQRRVINMLRRLARSAEKAGKKSDAALARVDELEILNGSPEYTVRLHDLALFYARHSEMIENARLTYDALMHLIIGASGYHSSIALVTMVLERADAAMAQAVAATLKTRDAVALASQRLRAVREWMRMGSEYLQVLIVCREPSIRGKAKELKKRFDRLRDQAMARSSNITTATRNVPPF